jgi:hypothetical protein
MRHWLWPASYKCVYVVLKTSVSGVNTSLESGFNHCLIAELFLLKEMFEMSGKVVICDRKVL